MRPLLTRVALLLVVGALLGAVIRTVVSNSGSVTTVVVTANGHDVEVPIAATVDEVLRNAHLQPRDGRLLAIASHAVLDPHSDPARVLLNDRPVPNRSARVRAGDHLQVIDGHDAIEPSTTRSRTIPAPAGDLPDVETTLWSAPVDGEVDDLVGTRSGEVASSTVVRAPMAAAAQTGPVVALTFDDGPDPRFTPQILAILAAAGIRATFCVVGYSARAFPDLIQAEHTAGHLLCDHTESHPRLDRIPTAQIDGQIASLASYLQQSTGQAPTFMRAPYGVTTPDVVAAAHRQHLRILGWNDNSTDYNRPDPTTITARVLAGLAPGGVVLMHDGGGDRTNTVSALPSIIAGIQARGYTFGQPGTTPTN